MEKTLQQLWNNFKAQPEIWFFYGFLLTSMLLVRKVLAEYPLAGAFNEYTGIYLYLSDIFLLLGLLSWGISILKNKNDDLSRYRLSWNALKPLFYALAVFLGWALVSVAWAERPEIGYFKFLKLFEMVLLGLFLGFHPSQNVPRGTSDGASAKHGNNFRWNILRIIIFLGVLNSLIGIGQFLLQHSVGLFWLRESLIGPDIPGVAKIIIGGQKYIRIYGLFPHPNILAGFLLLSILATLVYRKMFYLTPTFSLARRGRLGEVGICSMWNSFCILNWYWIWGFFLAIQIVGLILTLSKSAILGLAIALAYLYWQYNPSVSQAEPHPNPLLAKEREIGRGWDLFHVEHFLNWVRNRFELLKSPKNGGFKFLKLFGTGLFIGFFASFLRFVTWADFYAFWLKSFHERLPYLLAARNMIVEHPLIGVGLGQFVPRMQEFFSSKLLDWQYQPVHNVFLLVWSEVGIIGLFGLFQILRTIWKGQKMFHMKQNSSKNTSQSEVSEIGTDIYGEDVSRLPRQMFPVEHSDWGGTVNVNLATYIKAVLVGFTFIALFDHYLWDIQQGQIMLWLTLGLLLGVEHSEDTIDKS